MKRTGAIIGLMALMIFTTASLAFAKGLDSEYPGCFGPNCGRARGHDAMIWNDPNIIAKVGLNPEQVEALKKLDFDFKEKAINEKFELEKAQLALEKAISSKALNEQAVRKAAGRLVEQNGKLMMLKIELQLAVRKVLSAEQLLILESISQKKRTSSKREKRHHRHIIDR